jgi:hypothetical protein
MRPEKVKTYVKLNTLLLAPEHEQEWSGREFKWGEAKLKSRSVKFK